MARYFTSFLFVLFVYSSSAQTPVVKVIDNQGNGNFISVSDAVSYINDTLAELPEGGIEFQLVDGQYFIDSIPVITAFTSETKPLIFTQQGDGEKPTIAWESSDDHYILQILDMGYVTVSCIRFEETTVGNEDELYLYGGILVKNGFNITISDCEFVNIAKYPIYIDDASFENVVERNVIMHEEEYISPESSVYGFYQSYHPSSGTLYLNGNTVYGLNQPDGSIYGIRVSGANSLITNNMVYLNSLKKVYGLRIDGFDERTIHAYYNSIIVDGPAIGKGYAVDFEGAGGDIYFTNNICVNNREVDSDSTQFAVMVGFNGPNHIFSHNIYYLEHIDSTHFKGEYYDSLCFTIPIWQEASETDEGSRVFDVAFAEYPIGDLHLDNSMALIPELAGVIVDTVNYDFDDEERGLMPYIGADEAAYSPFPYHELTIVPDTLDFGQIQVGSSNTEIIQVTNELDQNTTIEHIAAPSCFYISTDDEVFSDTLFNIELLASETKDLYIKFEPQETGNYNGHIELLAGVQSFTGFLAGEGVSPFMVLSANELDFGNVAIYTDSVMPFYIANTSGEVLNVDIELPVDFTFRIDGTDDWLSSINEEIPAEDNLTGFIRFLPNRYNNYYDEVTVSTEGLVLALMVEGRSIGVDLRVEATLNGLWVSDSDWGDFDNDGDMDLFHTGYSLVEGGETYVYENLGNFNLQPINQEFAGVGNVASQWVDYDNDGDLDVFLTGQDDFDVYKVYFYTNNNGQFIESEPENILPLTNPSIDWGDFDRDGDLDILMTGKYEYENDDLEYFTKIYRNEGNMQFTDIPHDITHVSSGDAKWADFDNDGDMDIALLGNTNESFVFVSEIYENNNSQFIKLDLDILGLRYGEVHWGDYDNDHDLDVFFNGSFDLEQPSVSFVMQNNGDGTFTETELMQIGTRQGDSKWIDLDSDGDLDIVINGLYTTALWRGYIYVYNENEEYELVDSIVELKYADFSFADVDNDNRIDMFLGGRYDYQDYRSYVYKNYFHSVNTTPEAPSAFEANVSDTTVNFTWNHAFDDNGNTLTYNLRVGTETGIANIYNGLVSFDGKRLVNRSGNMGMNTGFGIPFLPNGIYYASIQSIDNSYAASEWSNEVEFNIDFNGINDHSLHGLTVYPNPVKDVFSIQIFSNLSQSCEVKLRSYLGQSIQTKETRLTEGLNVIKFDAAELKSGSYIISIETNGCLQSRIIVID